MSDLTRAIERARQALEGAKQLSQPVESERAADELMEAISQLGRLLYGEASTVATRIEGERVVPARAAELDAFVAETEQALYQAEPGLAGWLWSARDRRPEDDGSYRRWLHDRSAIEFLRELYRGTDGGEYAAALGTAGFDEEIRFRAEQYNVGAPPAGTPRHHWWWWLKMQLDC